MALLPSNLRRPAALLQMAAAMAQGLTVEGFIKELRGTIGTYRRTLMLADWRSVNNIEARKDVVKYTRKDRIPSIKVIADVEWDMKTEYMYKCKVWSQTQPGKPLKERFVNIRSDRLVAIGTVERMVYERWADWEKYEPEELKRVEVVAIFHKVETLFEVGD